jgi:AAA+ ATPase superfamily predicted ATPase
MLRKAIVDAIDELQMKKPLMCIYTIDEIYKLAENLFNNNREKYTEYYYNKKINTQYGLNTQYGSNANQYPISLKC